MLTEGASASSHVFPQCPCAERSQGWRVPSVSGLHAAPGVCSLSPSLSLGYRKIGSLTYCHEINLSLQLDKFILE